MEKTFVLHSQQHKQSAINFITRLSLEELHEVSIKPHEKTRTLEQNKRLWALLQEVSDHIPDENGELHGREYWHFRLRSEFNYIEGTCKIKGYDCPMPKSSTKMSTYEMSSYQEQIVQLLVEHGIPLPDWV